MWETGLDDGLVDELSFTDPLPMQKISLSRSSDFPGLPVMGLSHDFSAELALVRHCRAGNGGPESNDPSHSS